MTTLSRAMAFVGGPIGLAIIALAAGIMLVAQAGDRARRRLDEMRTSLGGAKTSLDAYEEAARTAANTTGEGARAAAEAAARNREQAASDVLRARAAYAAAAAMAAATEATREKRAEEQRSAVSRGSRSAALGVDSGIYEGAAAVAAGAQDELRARAAGWLAAERRLAAIDTNAASGAYRNTYTGGGAADSGGGSRASGPTAAELAAMREQIRLTGELDLAQARGDEAEARRIQRLIDIASLTEQMTRAQIAGAEALATAQVDAVMSAEAVGKEIDKLIEASEGRAEARLAAQEALSAEMDRQLQVQIELARIEGSEAVVVMLERELRLRQAINALGPNASPELVARVRGDEAMLNGAEDQAIYRERGAEMARTFVDIVQADDIGTEIGNRFRAAAFDQLESFLSNVFSQMFSAQGGAGGGGLGGSIGSFLGSLFGGNRALGGPVRAGKAYRVNENTPKSEIFVPDRDGWVGNMKAPRGAGRAVQNITATTNLYLDGANGDAVIYANVGRMLAASQRQTVAAIKAGAPAAQLEQTLLRE